MNKKTSNLTLHIFCIALTILFLSGCIFVLPSSFSNLIGSFKDLGISLYNYATAIFNKKPEFLPSGVNDIPEAVNIPFLPESFEAFSESITTYFQRLFSTSNFFGYLIVLLRILVLAVLFSMPVFALAVLLIVYVNQQFKKESNKPNKDSLPLRFYKKTFEKAYFRIKEYVVLTKEFLSENKYYYRIWLVIILYAFNIFKIIISALAYVFYATSEMNFSTILIQLYKLLIDLSPAFIYIPWWVFLIAGIIIFNRIRERRALERLRHLEARNKGYIKSLPVAVMFVGPMGSGKTTLSTDMSLSCEAIFRDDVLKIMDKYSMMFTHFPWINFEKEVKAAIRERIILNLASVKVYVINKYLIFKETENIKDCFDYNYKKYGLFYNNGIKELFLFDCLMEYARAYLIYTQNTSLIVSNYSIRSDNEIVDKGNLPVWNTDFFKALEKLNQFSHILDFDTLRLTKFVDIENLEKNGSFFEYGVLSITEIAKELGNQNTNRNKGVRADDYKANRINDGLVDRLKLIRNNATVDNIPFVKLFTDDQRADSLLADARELCEIIEITDVSEEKLTYSFFALGELLYDLVFSKFINRYHEYRFNRSDNILFMRLYTNAVTLINNRYNRIYNKYSYRVFRLAGESGICKGVRREDDYYIMSQKIYPNRFATDVFSGFFEQKALKAKRSLNETPCYSGLRATLEELKSTNSHFINEMSKNLLFDDNDDADEDTPEEDE